MSTKNRRSKNHFGTKFWPEIPNYSKETALMIIHKGLTSGKG